MTIDELIGQLTEAKTQGHAGSEPVYIWNDGDWTEIDMVDPGDGRIDLNMDVGKLEELYELKLKKMEQDVMRRLLMRREDGKLEKIAQTITSEITSLVFDDIKEEIIDIVRTALLKQSATNS